MGCFGLGLSPVTSSEASRTLVLDIDTETLAGIMTGIETGIKTGNY
jgi:hypothetical protein